MDLKADSDALRAQSFLHWRIAQFYRAVADQVQAGGGPIVNEFQRKQYGDYASAYQQWLSPDNFHALYDEASLHDSWSTYFNDLADKLDAADGVPNDDWPRRHRGIQ